MTLLDATQPNQEQERRRKHRIIMTVAVVGILLALGPVGFLAGHGWWFLYLPKERVVGHFFDELQKQDYKAAYGIWMHDDNWEHHPGEHTSYSFGDFYRDWGPGGEWGLIKTHRVYGASKCPSMGADTGGSGIVVDVVVNDRVQHAQVWVQNSDHTLSFPPCELVFH